MWNPNTFKRISMLTRLPKSLGCKIESKKKITNNIIRSNRDIFSHLGCNDLHKIRDKNDTDFFQHS